MATEPAVLLLGAGFRSAAAVAEWHGFAENWGATLTGRRRAVALLEPGQPTVLAALQGLLDQETHQITIAPVVLNLTAAAAAELRVQIERFRSGCPGVDVRCAAALGVHAKLLQAAADRVADGEAAAEPGYDRNQTLLLVAAAGSDDAEVNADAAKFTRMLGEGLGFGWSETGYLDAATPDLATVLAQVEPLGFRRALLFPYLIHGGEPLAGWCSRWPSLQLLHAAPLTGHPLIEAALSERLHQAEHGDGRMNCQFCAYRQPPARHHPDSEPNHE